MSKRNEAVRRQSRRPLTSGRQQLHQFHIVHVFGGIDRHAAVIFPAAVAGLRTRTCPDGPFEAHSVRCITGAPAGIKNSRINTQTGAALAYGHVAAPILSDTAHPTIRRRIGGVSALLRDERSSVGIADLVPAHACLVAARTDL